MNYYVSDIPAVNRGLMRKKLFRNAQNRVAVLMFLILGINVCASVLFFLPFIDSTDTFRYGLIQAVAYLLYMAAPVFMFGIISGRRLSTYFTFRKGRKGTAATGFFAMGVIYFAQLVATVVSVILDKVGAGSSLDMEPTKDPAVIILRVIYIAVLPAVFEELATRGIVLGELLPYGKGFAVIASGALFGLMHMNPIQLPFAFIAGTAMAYAVLYTKTLRVAITVHFINNFISVIFVSLPELVGEDTAFMLEAVVSVIIFIAGAVSGIYLLKHRHDPDEREGALCADTSERYRVDLRDGLSGNISPLLVIYAVTSVLITLLTLLALFVT